MNCTITASIPVSNLVMEKPADFEKGKAEELARSIESNGMIHRPVVRPMANMPEFYKVVAGRKRLYAAAKLLGWTEVECDVRGDLDDEAAESIELAENVFRTALSDEAQNKALIRWHAIHVKQHANADGRQFSKTRSSGGIDMLPPMNAAEMTAVSAKAEISPSDETGGATVSGLTPKPFARVLEQTLGISASAAKRKARIARNLTEDQITALAAKNVNNSQTDSIAALGNSDAITHAIQQIDSGMNADEAVRQAKKLKPEKPVKPEKTGKAPKAPTPPREKELTDDEWLATYCGTILSILKHKTSFRNDAICTGECPTRLCGSGQASRNTSNRRSRPPATMVLGF
jgi:hypothetical protein